MSLNKAITMRKLLSIAALFLLSLPTSAQQVKVGVEVLRDSNFGVLDGKRVGLITNPTGVDSQLRSTVDILHEAPNIELVALYGPEHGVRGDIHAGDKVDADKDAKTGVTIFSLYGATRKPTKEMLEGVDVLVYDIQDNGCRSYTFISTMGLAMEAAGEAGIPFVVLDRPNPLGGNRIEGNLVEPDFVSFVSQYPIPYIYGLTCGELANYLNRQEFISHPCDLTVVKLEGWKRDMIYEDTGLPWVAPSPHVPHASSALFYPISGILGELGIISIGVGYTMPFELFGAEWLDAEKLADDLNSKEIPGVVFRPIHYRPFYSVGKGKTLQGVQVHLLDPRHAPLSPIQFIVMEEIYKQAPEHPIFSEKTEHRYGMFDKVTGSNQIRERFSKNYRWEDIKEYWEKDVPAFREAASEYFLY